MGCLYKVKSDCTADCGCARRVFSCVYKSVSVCATFDVG